MQFVNGIFANGHEEILKFFIHVSVSVQNHSEILTRFSILEKNRSASEVKRYFEKQDGCCLTISLTEFTDLDFKGRTFMFTMNSVIP